MEQILWNVSLYVGVEIQICRLGIIPNPAGMGLETNSRPVYMVIEPLYNLIYGELLFQPSTSPCVSTFGHPVTEKLTTNNHLLFLPPAQWSSDLANH
ncbi:hypothetical protein C2845_PM06G23210 [Panicum miliaceum]|uniref:Uncharacterized protein n=1 Tax=Panicum miliaceum TaxID=4540 RepID=A0A3L6RCC5_PANMI|nr:hypothetical protein C2845_PM06G23210 [Panicum miliaceum]